jgi:hypothetical protein
MTKTPCQYLDECKFHRRYMKDAFPSSKDVAHEHEYSHIKPGLELGLKPLPKVLHDFRLACPHGYDCALLYDQDHLDWYKHTNTVSYDLRKQCPYYADGESCPVLCCKKHSQDYYHIIWANAHTTQDVW